MAEYDSLSHFGVIATTDKAVLVLLDPPTRDLKGEQVWVPRSCLEDPEEPDAGDPPGELEVKTWFLKKEGLI